MKKIILCLSLMVLVLSSFTLNVYADDETQEYTVYYKDGAISSDDFSESTIGTILDSLEPGDSVTINITLKNASSRSVDWYMKNTSSNFDANNGIFTYRLSYGSTDLYNSTTVGGEEGQGIEGATDDFADEWFELGIQKPGESSVVTMYLALDGETLDYEYEIDSGSLTAEFELEEIPEAHNVVEHHTRIVYIPYTGDTINLNFYIIMEFAALILLAIVVFAYYIYNRRQERSK